MKDLDNILKRYFEGETTLSEERKLREYFLKEDVEEKYKSYIPMFRFFSEECQSEPKMIEFPRKRIKKLYYFRVGIAACIFIMAGILTFFIGFENDKPQTLVYVDGEKISDIQLMNEQMLLSLKNISEIEEDALSSQIEVLDFFTE